MCKGLSPGSYFADTDPKGSGEYMIKTLNKSDINFYTGLFIFFPFIFLAFSGLLIAIYYHAGGYLEQATVLGVNRSGWLYFHKLTAVISLLGITVHLFLHTGWIKMLLKKKILGSTKSTKITVLLFIALFAVSLTGIFCWLFLPAHVHLEKYKIIEIHEKIGIILTVLFIFHFINHWRWMVRKFSN